MDARSETAEQPQLPELPEGWRAHPPEPDRDDAQVHADEWTVYVDRDGYTVLRVRFRDGAEMSIASSGECIDPMERTIDFYETLRPSIRSACPRPNSVRLALDWCRAALEAAS